MRTSQIFDTYEPETTPQTWRFAKEVAFRVQYTNPIFSEKKVAGWFVFFSHVVALGVLARLGML